MAQQEKITLADDQGEVTVTVRLRDDGNLALQIKPESDQDVVIADAYLRGAATPKVLVLKRVDR